MKKEVKSTISCFRLLIEHSQKGYEPSPEHILRYNEMMERYDEVNRMLYGMIDKADKFCK